MERIPYELSVLISLREAIRRREIWIEGSRRWGDPETDLPQDFEEHREQHYAALSSRLTRPSSSTSSTPIWTPRLSVSPARCGAGRPAG